MRNNDPNNPKIINGSPPGSETDVVATLKESMLNSTR